jgi:hypothetical protein
MTNRLGTVGRGESSRFNDGESFGQATAGTVLLGIGHR